MTMKTKQQLFAQKVISVVNCDFPTPHRKAQCSRLAICCKRSVHLMWMDAQQMQGARLLRFPCIRVSLQ